MDVVPASLTPLPSLYAVGDLRDGWPPAEGPDEGADSYAERWRAAVPPGPAVGTDLAAARRALRVAGGYMERLPLACVKAGLVDHAEKWHFWCPPTPCPSGLEQSLFGWRTFHLRDQRGPFRSEDMLAFLRVHGAPHILCVWGLGVAEEMLLTCKHSLKVYNSIDAPPLRVPPEVSRHFDLVLVGAEWQRAEVQARHPGMPCAILPIGPEFADPDTFRPLGSGKDYDLVYVAAAQPYKRHDILFDALARCRRPVRALCVCGYGELGDELRRQARDRGLPVDIVGPPGVPFAQVNALMNRARAGVVCGIDDGCPAILTEYMLAGLPVLANARLCCGLDYVTPETGLTAEPERFHEGIEAILDLSSRLDPRAHALPRWTWPASVERFADILAECGWRRPGSG